MITEIITHRDGGHYFIEYKYNGTVNKIQIGRHEDYCKVLTKLVDHQVCNKQSARKIRYIRAKR